MPNIAVYTCLFGGYDQLLTPLLRSPNCDYFCFTDDPNLRSDFWQIHLLTADDSANAAPNVPDTQRLSRQPKILPHRYFPDYDASLYLDANLLLIGDLDDYIARYHRHSPLLLLKHGERDCLYEELQACLEGQRDDPATMIQQVERYRSEGFPPHFGLAVGSFIYREHNNPQVIALMELWWQELSQGSKRDQLSLSYCLWKQNVSADFYYGNNWNNDYFIWLPHRISSNPYLSPEAINAFQPELLSSTSQRLNPSSDRALDQRSYLAAKVYLDFGQGLSEANVLYVPPSVIEGQNHYDFRLPQGTQAIRFDPIEGHPCLIDQLAITTDGMEIIPDQHNGQALSGQIYFATPDPQFTFATKGQVEKVEIRMRLKVITSASEQQLLETTLKLWA